MDTVGNKGARFEIAIKVVAAPRDDGDRPGDPAVRGAGVSDDWPLASMYTTPDVHLVDGPDEVHSSRSPAELRPYQPSGSA
jgi:hypothetical protein